MDFDKAALVFTMQEPFYGIILSSMNRVPTDKVDTLAVTRKGNVFRLYYNPEFTDKMQLDTLLQLIKHEMLHICLHHFSVWGDPDGFKPDEDEQHLRNIAADLEANCYVDLSKVHDIQLVTCEYYSLEKQLGAREYRRIILDDMQQQQAQGSPQKPCNGGQSSQQQQNSRPDSGNQQQNQNQQPKQSAQGNQGDSQSQAQQSGDDQSSQNDMQSAASGSSAPSMLGGFKNYDGKFSQAETFDDHSMWPQMSDSEMEDMEQAVDELMSFAADEVEKGQGYVPGELKGRIEKLRKKPRPVCNWKKYLRRYLGNEFTEDIRKSKKRESRRFPDAAGNRHQRKSHILVAIDTSGSVSMPEYMEFMGQLRTLHDKATFHVVECDTTIQYEYDYNGKENLILHGGGGTEFYPPINMFLENRREYDALVYFTDGYCEIPKNTPKDTLWVISSRGDQNRDKYRVNGANSVFIKPIVK